MSSTACWHRSRCLATARERSMSGLRVAPRCGSSRPSGVACWCWESSSPVSPSGSTGRSSPSSGSSRSACWRWRSPGRPSRAAPVAELSLRPQPRRRGQRAARRDPRVQAGAAPMLFAASVTVAVGGTAASRSGCPSSRRIARHTESVPLPPLPRGRPPGRTGDLREDRPGRPGGQEVRVGELRSSSSCAPRVTDLSVFAGGLTNDLDGATSQQLSMNDLAFHALREYVPGDDLRHVHWRSSAKAGELLVRQYHETRRGHVTILVDDARCVVRPPARLRAGRLRRDVDRPARGARRLRHLPAQRSPRRARPRAPRPCPTRLPVRDRDDDSPRAAAAAATGDRNRARRAGDRRRREPDAARRRGATASTRAPTGWWYAPTARTRRG